jgi:hypothetical protein
MCRGIVIFSVVITALAGCNRHDTESLSRIGRKVASHAKQNAGDVGA